MTDDPQKRKQDDKPGPDPEVLIIEDDPEEGLKRLLNVNDDDAHEDDTGLSPTEETDEA